MKIDVKKLYGAAKTLQNEFCEIERIEGAAPVLRKQKQKLDRSVGLLKSILTTLESVEVEVVKDKKGKKK